MPVDQEANIKQLTYQQIREFYYAELLDTVSLNCSAARDAINP